MMKLSRFAILLSVELALVTSCKRSTDVAIQAVPSDSASIYFYSFTDIDGNQVKLSDMKGKKIMFVNTASYCVNTPQYTGLENLYNRYKDRLIIIGFPCNDFGGQEPGNRDSIKGVCTAYNITFPLSQKIDILGAGMHPIYKWLTTKELNGKFSSAVDWNFQKYLVNTEGALVAKFENYTAPEDSSIIKEIEK